MSSSLETELRYEILYILCANGWHCNGTDMTHMKPMIPYRYIHRVIQITRVFCLSKSCCSCILDVCGDQSRNTAAECGLRDLQGWLQLWWQRIVANRSSWSQVGICHPKEAVFFSLFPCTWTFYFNISHVASLEPKIICIGDGLGAFAQEVTSKKHAQSAGPQKSCQRCHAVTHKHAEKDREDIDPRIPNSTNFSVSASSAFERLFENSHSGVTTYTLGGAMWGRAACAL